MGVYKRPKCEWKNGRATWYYQFRVNKVRHYDGIFDTRKQAKDAEDKAVRELNSKRATPIIKEDVTVEEFFPKYLEHRGTDKSAEYRKREERRSRPIIEHFRNFRLRDVNVADIHEYVTKRKKQDGLANRSINLELTLFRNLYRYAIELNYADFNPPKEIKNLQEVHDEHWIPEPEELERFALECGRTSSGLVMEIWTRTMAYTGARPGENCRLQWSDIDFDKEQIRITNSKHNGQTNRKYRYVEMHEELKPILLKWRAKWEQVFAKRHKRHPEEPYPLHDHVFYNSRDQKVAVKSFCKCFYQARDRAGLPLMTRHTLRHYFVSRCVMSGINFFTIAGWVHHKNTRMIEEVYGHLSPGYRRKQMAKLRVGGDD